MIFLRHIIKSLEVATPKTINLRKLKSRRHCSCQLNAVTLCCQCLRLASLCNWDLSGFHAQTLLCPVNQVNDYYFSKDWWTINLHAMNAIHLYHIPSITRQCLLQKCRTSWSNSTDPWIQSINISTWKIENAFFRHTILRRRHNSNFPLDYFHSIVSFVKELLIFVLWFSF